MPETPGALTLQFLEWIEERPRTYDDAMEHWKTSCPRMSIWEDALLDGLIQLGEGRQVLLTHAGRDVLRSAQARR